MPKRLLLLDVAGRGAAGRVYKAYDRWGRRIVAVKVLDHDTADTEAALRFMLEQRASLDHPCLMPVLDFLTTDSCSLLVSEYVPDSLEDLLERGGLVPQDQLRLAVQLLAGVGHLHACGVIHRDVKPSNILVDRRASGLLARLGDLGLALHLDSPRITSFGGPPLGTVGYLAPELLEGAEADEMSDLYAVGVTLRNVVSTSAEAHPAVVSLGDLLCADRSSRPRSAEDAVSALRTAVGADVVESVEDDTVAASDEPASSAAEQRSVSRRLRTRQLVRITAPVAVIALLSGFAYTSIMSPGSVGKARFLVPAPVSEARLVRSAVTLAALSYEVAGVPDPGLVRLAVPSILQGANPCDTFAECVALVRKGRPIRFRGPEAWSPMLADVPVSFSFAGVRNARPRPCEADWIGRCRLPDGVEAGLWNRSEGLTAPAPKDSVVGTVRQNFRVAQGLLRASRPFEYGPPLPSDDNGVRFGLPLRSSAVAVRALIDAVAEVNAAGGVLRAPGVAVASSVAAQVDVRIAVQSIGDPVWTVDRKKPDGSRLPALAIDLFRDARSAATALQNLGEPAQLGDPYGPIDQPSYLAWTAAQGLVRSGVPAGPGHIGLVSIAARGQPTRAAAATVLGLSLASLQDAASFTIDATAIAADNGGCRALHKGVAPDLGLGLRSSHPPVKLVCTPREVAQSLAGLSLRRDLNQRTVWVVLDDSRRRLVSKVSEFSRKGIDLDRLYLLPSTS